MRSGTIILCIFAIAWAVAGIVLQGLQLYWAALPLGISLALIAWAARRASKVSAGPHVGRLVGIWSGVEGAAMFLTANFLINSQLPTAVMPAFAIIVGLHFLPLAHGIPVRIYYTTGTSLVLLGLVGLLTPLQPLLLGVGAAVILWVSVAALVTRTR